MKRKTLIWMFALFTAISLLIVACGPTDEDTSLEDIAGEEVDAPEDEPADETDESEDMVDEPMGLDGPIVVGSKDFTEQLILGSMVVQLLEANGYEVDDQTGLGGTTVNRNGKTAAAFARRLDHPSGQG